MEAERGKFVIHIDGCVNSDSIVEVLKTQPIPEGLMASLASLIRQKFFESERTHPIMMMRTDYAQIEHISFRYRNEDWLLIFTRQPGSRAGEDGIGEVSIITKTHAEMVIRALSRGTKPPELVRG